MCSMYWNLITQIKCPKCKRKRTWELQTHFMGEVGSCINRYQLNEPVEELKGVTVTLDGKNDAFCGDCPACDVDVNNPKLVFYHFGAEIVEGKVIRVWLLK